MRLRRAAALTLGFAAAGVSLPVLLRPAPAYATPAASPAAVRAPAPACGARTGRDFPLRTRVHGGPGTYRAGGGAEKWTVDLTNTTGKECRGIHPVIVVTDRGRSLRSSHLALQLADGRGRLRGLSLQTTDEDEIIGVPDPGAAAFSVPPHGTVTVDARLAFTAAAHEDEVQVSAATVQRRGTDGEWVGESNTYRLTVVGAVSGEHESDTGGRTAGDTEAGTADPGTGTADSTSTTGADTPRTSGTGDTAAPHDSGVTGARTARPDGQASAPGGVTPGATAPDTAGTGTGSSPGAGTPSPSSHSLLPELAATGAAGVLARTALAAALIASGVLLVVLVGRRRTRRSRS